MGLNVAGNLAVFLLSLKYGIGGWRRLDVVALAIATIDVAVTVGVGSLIVTRLGSILAYFSGTS